MQKFRRHILRRRDYTDNEKNRMRSIHNCFTRAIGDNVPSELLMDKDFNTSHHEVSKEDLFKSFWVPKLNKGLLKTEADSMVGEICAYIAHRYDRKFFKNGNPNDPYNLVAFELLTWVTKELSGAPCNKDTLEMVEKRISYLDYLDNTDVFPPGESSGKTMLGVIMSLKLMLMYTVVPIIKREIANGHAREHLNELRTEGKDILNYGFQFLYYVISKINDMPSANMSKLRSKSEEYSEFLGARSGQLLDILIRTPQYLDIFKENFSQVTPYTASSNNYSKAIMPNNSAQGQLALRFQQTSGNPFADENNQPCIPKSLCRMIEYCEKIENYFDVNAKGKDVQKTGVYKPFRQDKEIMRAFVKMHMLLHEMSKVFWACNEAYDLAGEGGDILVYGFGNKQINGLMDTMKKLSGALEDSFTTIQGLCDRKKGSLTSTNKTQKDAWVKNFKEIHTIGNQLKNAILAAKQQTDFVKSSANEVSTEERIQRAREKTLCFTQTSTLLTSHVDHLLEGKATPKLESIATDMRMPGLLRNDGGSIPESEKQLKLLANDQQREINRLQDEISKLRVDLVEVSEISECANDERSVKYIEKEEDLDRLVDKLEKENKLAELLKTARQKKEVAKEKRAAKKLARKQKKMSAKGKEEEFEDVQTVGKNDDNNNNENTKLYGSEEDASETETELEGQVVLMPTLRPIQNAYDPDKTIDWYGIQGAREIDDTSVGVVRNLLIMKPGVEKIILTKNHIRGEGAKLLCGALMQHFPLRSLDLWGNSELFSGYQTMQSDKVPVPQGNFISRLFKKAPEKIVINDNDNNVEPLAAANAFSNLLAEHENLQHLVINECGLVDQMDCVVLAKGLAANKSLLFLDVGYNGFGDDAAETICNALANHPLMSNLRIGGNAITDVGAKAILELVKANDRITDIDINGNEAISADLRKQIIDQVVTNKDPSANSTTENKMVELTI